MIADQPHIFAGNASKALGQMIADYLNLPISKSECRSFSDGETWVKIDENVRGARCFVIQSTSHPVNDHLIELLMFIDALRRASAASVTAVVPYFGYARQDRKDQGRVALSAKLIANLITVAGANRVLTMDLHAGQIQGFFDIPVDHLFAAPVMVERVRSLGLENMAVVSPDIGSVKRARNYALLLDAPLIILDKRRPKPNECEVLNVMGDAQGCNAFIFDDLIDTAGTICEAANALRQNGAKDIYAACTHGVLSGPAMDRLSNSGLKKVFVTDTVPQNHTDNVEILEEVSVAPLLGEAIRRINNNQSVSALFR
ncbi:ribose-phosphate pyrophosphokinase [bacterium]|nr:ribose-phosphate pyrophosphokinase [bacterium]